MAIKGTRGQHLVIDLGSYAIKFIVGNFNQNQIKISNAFSINVSEGIYTNGKIENSTALVNLIKKSLNDNDIKVKNTIVTFSSTEVIQREMIVPKLSYDDTIGLIRYDISQYLPIDVDEYDVTYLIKSVEKSDEIEKYNVLVYIVKKEMIDAIHELVKSCGLVPTSLDLHSNAVSKFISYINEDSSDLLSDGTFEKKSIALVDLGYKNMLIDILVNGTSALSRTVGLGFYNQDKVIAEKFSLSLEDAETFRKEKLSYEIEQLHALYDALRDVDFENTTLRKEDLGIGEGVMNDEERQLFSLLRDCMREYNEMGSELSKILQYYLSRNKDNKIDKVLFHGSSAQNESLISFLSSILEYESRAIDFRKINTIVFPEGIENQASYVNAIGALLTRQEA